MKLQDIVVILGVTFGAVSCGPTEKQQDGQSPGPLPSGVTPPQELEKSAPVDTAIPDKAFDTFEYWEDLYPEDYEDQPQYYREYEDPPEDPYGYRDGVAYYPL